MPKLGLGVTASQTSTILLPPPSQYTGTNALLSTRLSDLSGCTPLVESNNGDPAGAYIVGETTYPINDWKHFSPTFTNIVNYKSLAPKYFLNAYPPYSIGGGPAGRHLIKQSGIGSTLIGFNSLTRTYPDPPMRQITSDTSTGAGSSTTNWAKYEMYQIVDIPVGATVLNYGAMILCPANDDLRAYNFGGMYIFAGAPSPARWSIDYSAICGVSVPILPNSQGAPTYQNYQEATSSSLFMWAGPSFALPGEEIPRWNSDLFLRGLDVLDGGANTAQRPASDYRTWKQLNVRIPLPLGGSGNGVDNTKLGFSMYFAESHSYLNDDGTPSGSIWFYDPYVVFS